MNKRTYRKSLPEKKKKKNVEKKGKKKERENAMLYLNIFFTLNL
jgi:hypothetical protein